MKDQILSSECCMSCNEKVAVYIATHNQKVEISEDYLIPIQTGAVFSGERLCELRDDWGNHISERNKTFCELTALYWIWKNDSTPIVGLSHYRRRFLIDRSRILSVLNEYDVITPTPYYFRNSLYNEYGKRHIISDFHILQSVIEERYPEMNDAFSFVFANNKMLPYNMLIAKREFFEAYCEWLFDILMNVEQKIDISERNDYQKRVFGFLSERLFMVYVLAKDVKTYECPVMIPEMQTLYKRVKYRLGIRFNRAYFTVKHNILGK